MSGAKKYDFSAFEEVVNNSNQQPLANKYDYSAFDEALKKKGGGTELKDGSTDGTSPTESQSLSKETPKTPKPSWQTSALNPLTGIQKAKENQEAKQKLQPQPTPTAKAEEKPVDYSLAKKYESAQNLYSLADKQHKDAKQGKTGWALNYISPIFEDIEEAISPAYKQEKQNNINQAYTALQNESKNAKNAQLALKAEIPKILSPLNSDLNNYVDKSTDGAPIPNIYKIDEFAKNEAKKAGLPEDGYFKKVIYNEAKANVAQKIIEPKVNEKFNELYKKETGKNINEDLKSDYDKGFVKAQEIKQKTELTAKQIATDISLDTKNKINELQTSLTQQVDALNSEVTTGAQAINEKYKGLIQDNRFVGNEQQYKEYQQDIASVQSKQKENELAYQKLNKDFINQQHLISTKANARYRRQIEEISRFAQNNIEKESLKYSQSYKQDPKTKERIERLYKQAYGQTLSENEKLKSFVSDVSNTPTVNFAKSIISSLGGTMKGISTSIGFDAGQTFGDYLENKFQVGSSEIKSLSDVIDPQKMAKSGGQLVGGMLPSMLGSMGAAYATGGESAIVQLVTTGLAGWAGETIDIAGRAESDKFEATGDAVAAKEASRKTVDSQVMLMPLYALEGLPFMEAPLNVSKNKIIRAAIGGAIEYGAEVPQEYLQNLSEEAIKNDESYKDMFKYHSAEKLKNTALNIAPVFLLGSVGQLTKQTEEEKSAYATEQAAKSFALKTKFADLAPSQREQFLFDVMQRQGVDFTSTYLLASYTAGHIDKATFEEMGKTLVKSADILNKAEKLGLSPAQTKVLNAFSVSYDKAKQAFDEETDPLLKSIASAKLVDYETQINSLATKQESNYAVVSYPNNEQYLFTHTELENALNNQDFANAISNGEISITLNGDKEKLNKKIEDAKSSIAAAKEEQKNVLKEKEKEIKKDIESKFNVQVQDNVGELGVEVQGLGTEEETEQAKQALRDAGIKIRGEEIKTEEKQQAELPKQPEVEKLRAEEQAELDTKIPNAEQYRVDGKVDRSKLTSEEDKAAFDEVYDKYDKLITPLLKGKNVGEVTPEEADIEKIQKEIDSYDEEYNNLVDLVNKEDRRLNTPKSENEIKLNQLQDKIQKLTDKRDSLKSELPKQKENVGEEVVTTRAKNKTLTGVKYEDIVIGDKRLEDILDDNNLSDYEKDKVRDIFSRGINYFEFNKEDAKKWQEKFINPEDIEEVSDLATAISAKQQSDFQFHNDRNYENVKSQIDYIVNNPKDFSPNIIKVISEIKEKLDNPNNSMERLYAIDVMKALGIKEQKEEAVTTPTKVEEVKTEVKPVEVKEGDVVELPSQVKGGVPRTMVFNEGEWRQRVGGNITNVGKNVKQQAQDAFTKKAEVVTTEEKVTAKPEVLEQKNIEKNVEIPIGADIKNNVKEEHSILPISLVDKMRTQGKSRDTFYLENDIEKNGIKRPIELVYHVHDEKIGLSDGHNRLDALKDIGADNVPVVLKISGADAPSTAIEVDSKIDPLKVKKISDLDFTNLGFTGFKQAELPEQPKTKTQQIGEGLLSILGIPTESKEGEVKFSKTTGEPEVLTPKEDKEKEIVDQMNSMNLVNKGVDISSPATTKEKIDVKELNTRLDNPLNTVKWEDFEGMPFTFTISDQLRTGDIKNPNTGETITDLKGGIGFNGTEGNENNAWANTTKEEAESMLQRAKDVYENNKPLFEKLWKEGKLPDGHIPMAVVKMAETSILSNEAVFRTGIQNIETLPKANRKKAVSELAKSMKAKINTETASLKRGVDKNGKPYSENTIKQKKKAIGQYQKILDAVKENKYEDIVDVLKDKDNFSLPEKTIIANEIFYGSPTSIGGKEIDITRSRPNTPVSKALIGNKNPALINLGKITDLLTEPSMKNVPNMHIVSVVGIDIKNPKVNQINHTNYPYGVKGKSLGVLESPIHMKDAFGEAYGSALGQVVKNEAENTSISVKNALTQGIPVQSGLPNRVFKSAIAKGKLDAVDKLAGFLRQAFPNTTFFTSQDAWDAAMSDPSIKKKLKDGDVVYAFTTDGNVFINPELKTTKATLHETGHIWMGFVKENNPGLHNKGLDLVTGTKEHQKAINEYGDTELAREEALMELMSTKGETILNASQKAQFKEWLLSVYKYIADNFKSLMGLSPKEIENLTLDKFLEGMLSDILSGKELTTKKIKGEVKFSLESQEAKIKDYIDSQRKAGESEEDIRAGIESVADKIGLTKEGIDSLMSGEVKAEVKKEPTITTPPPPPTTPKVNFGEGEEGKNNKKEFDKLTSTIPNTGEMTKYLSGETIEKYEGEVPRNEQDVYAQQLMPALKRGIDIIEKAKELFGDKYIENTLDYLETENLSPANKALIYISLENELAKQKIENPDNIAKIEKMQDLVRTKSQAFLRSNSLAINFGRLRSFAKAGYDISKLTDRFFSSKQMEEKSKIEKAVQATADDINKEAETQINEQALTDEEIKSRIEKGVEEEVAKLYEKLPKEKKRFAVKAISALDKIQKSLRNKSYSDVTGITAFIDAGITTIKAAIKAGIKVADAIEMGIDKIKKMYEDKNGKAWEKENEFRKDITEALKAEGIIDKKAKSKEKTQEERLADAKEKINKKIEEVQSEIINKKRVEKKGKQKLKADEELNRLKERLSKLEALRDKYLPKEKNPFTEEKNLESAKNKLTKDILELNRQIEKGQKDKLQNKESKENKELDALRDEKETRQAILEALDPTPRQFIENALIEQGYGRQVNVKTKSGVEKRWVLDWKKLAGEEGSVDNIRERVESSLRDKGYTEEQILRMQDGFVEEYNNLRQSIIEKAQTEIAVRNKVSVTPEQKSAAKKLAEMYNYGLFDKDITEYETALSRTIGVDTLSQENLKSVIELGKAMSDLFSNSFQGKSLTESQIRSAIQVIEEHMRYVLRDEASKHGGNFLKVADITRTYMDTAQRMTLNSFKQAIENPISGRLESLYSSIGYGGKISKELTNQQRDLARSIYKEMVLQKGVGYGNVSSAFVNKGNIDMYINKMPDNELMHAITSTAIGKTTLDAVDSFYKAKITQQKFTHNLIKILTEDRIVDNKIEKGMSVDDAKKYVAEKLTGQSFKEAQETAKNIIDKVNDNAGEKILNDSQLFVDRLANDIVNAALINGEKITEEMVNAAYNAAYKAAGRGLGHVANNFISRGTNAVSGRVESEINQAIKEKEYNKAAVLTFASIFFRNIANPFVGGGSNWVILKLEKTGLGLLSGLGSMMSGGRKLDLTTESGIAKIEDAMYQSMKVKDKFIRGAVGGAITVLTALLFEGIKSTDEYEKWKKRNKWADKYLNIITPEIVLAMLAQKGGEMKKYLENAFNKNESFDKGKMSLDAIRYLSEGEKEKGMGKAGELMGSSIGSPIPWRLVRDGQQVWEGVTGKEVYAVNNNPSLGLMEGYFKGGMIDYLGIAPSSEDKSRILTKDELEKPEYKIYKEKEIKIPETRSRKTYKVDTESGEMTPEQYDKFISLVNNYMENGFTKEDGYTEKEISGLKQLPQQTFKIKQKGESTEELLGSELSKEDLQNKVNQLHQDAVEQAKYDLKLTTKKPRRTVTEEK